MCFFLYGGCFSAHIDIFRPFFFPWGKKSKFLIKKIIPARTCRMRRPEMRSRCFRASFRALKKGSWRAWHFSFLKCDFICYIVDTKGFFWWDSGRKTAALECEKMSFFFFFFFSWVWWWQFGELPLSLKIHTTRFLL
jgi:hypothetical protein